MPYTPPIQATTSDPTVRRILQACGYKQRKVSIRPCTRVTLSGTYWDGGHRTIYTAVSLRDFRSGALPGYNPPQFGGPREDPEFELPADVVIVAFHYAGRFKYVDLLVHPDALTKLLPA